MAAERRWKLELALPRPRGQAASVPLGCEAGEESFDGIAQIAKSNKEEQEGARREASAASGNKRA